MENFNTEVQNRPFGDNDNRKRITYREVLDYCADSKKTALGVLFKTVVKVMFSKKTTSLMIKGCITKKELVVDK